MVRIRRQPDREPRIPYREMSYPEWVRISYCTVGSRTELLNTPHGVVKQIRQISIQY